MTAQGDHVVLKCQSETCGMRYPSPADDPRRNNCPLCETPVVEVGQFDEPPLPSEQHTHPGELIGVLDNIRSALNVGTMIRSADGAAFSRLILGGLTAPVSNPKVTKTALGAENAVPTESALDVLPAIERCRQAGFEVWAMDYTTSSEPLQEIALRPERLALVVGSETAGVDPAILALADRHVHLNMYGTKSTLNVGVAFGIAAYWLRALPVSAESDA